MIGNNEIHLNEASMIQAMQEYVDKRMGEHAPKVISVAGSGPYNNPSFVIKTTDKKVIPHEE